MTSSVRHVTEVMAFVDNDKVEVAPVDTFKVIAVGVSITARQIRMVENMIVEAVTGQINALLNTTSTIDDIFRQAQAAFNRWSDLPRPARERFENVSPSPFEYLSRILGRIKSEGVYMARLRFETIS